MRNEFERRLEALESRTVGSQRSTYEGLLAMLGAGLLSIPELTDTELWWILAGQAETRPDDAEVERRAAEVRAEVQDAAR